MKRVAVSYSIKTSTADVVEALKRCPWSEEVDCIVECNKSEGLRGWADQMGLGFMNFMNMWNSLEGVIENLDERKKKELSENTDYFLAIGDSGNHNNKMVIDAANRKKKPLAIFRSNQLSFQNC